ncbi:hypothetical protein F4679DRAFT_407035 [Xylaria curta]|nr:hypothetical protein F4679DRAFT_407035 [Xylaria curta]
MFQSFLAFIIETRLQLELGLDTADAPTPGSLAALRNSSLYFELRSLESSHPFRDLLRKNAFGRRFFITVNDRFGMTAVENADVAHPYYEDSLDDDYEEDHEEDYVRTSDYLDQNIEGLVIVACVGGRFPYMMWDAGRKQKVKPYLDRFQFCGECYLYDAMDGEDFKVRENSQCDQKGLRVFSYDGWSLAEIAIE